MDAHLKGCNQKVTGLDLCGQLSEVGKGRLEREKIKADLIHCLSPLLLHMDL